LELTGDTRVHLLPNDIRRICESLPKLQIFQATTDITDEDGNALLTTFDLQPFSRIHNLELLFIQFDGSNITTSELKSIPKSTSKLWYFDVSISIPPASARNFASALKRIFPQLESLSYDTATELTMSELSDKDFSEDEQNTKKVWDKVSSMLKGKRKI
jgi:hypothetical protein